ncbi:MAG TPA: response regulator [Opitutaceae bacterium]|nr:response regulator [Opitutaceae bacterium]
MQNSQTNSASPLRILLCDDFAEIRELLATMLRRDGFEVDAAGDGASGWDAFCARPYDLLITDNDMPLLTGLELVRRVRAIPHELPVIVISGFARWEDSDVKSLLEPGAFIEKPFAFPVLRAKVEELMNGKLARAKRGAPADTRPLPLQPEHGLNGNGVNAGHPRAHATPLSAASKSNG